MPYPVQRLEPRVQIRAAWFIKEERLQLDVKIGSVVVLDSCMRQHLADRERGELPCLNICIPSYSSERVRVRVREYRRRPSHKTDNSVPIRPGRHLRHRFDCASGPCGTRLSSTSRASRS